MQLTIRRRLGITMGPCLVPSAAVDTQRASVAGNEAVRSRPRAISTRRTRRGTTIWAADVEAPDRVIKKCPSLLTGTMGIRGPGVHPIE